MKHCQSPLLSKQIGREPAGKTTNGEASLKIAHVARLQAANHIRQAAKVISDAIPHVPDLDHQLYASIVGALSTLERHLMRLNQIQHENYPGTDSHA